MAVIWPIGGGKGGTGKSFLTANLGLALSQQGYKTLLVDVDLGAANLHTMIGLTDPATSLSDFIAKRESTLAATVMKTALPNLFLISGARNSLDVANLAHEQKMKILRAVTKLPYDYILLDLGAGTTYNTLDFFMVSDSGIFITTPEPTSIENIYRLIRAVYFRKIKQVLKSHDFKLLTDEASKRSREATVNNPEILLDVLKEFAPEQGLALETAIAAFHFELAVNQLRKQDNPNIGALICKIIRKHLGLKIRSAGNVSFDDRVHTAVCNRVCFAQEYPHTQTTTDILQICRNIMLGMDSPSPAGR